MKVFGGLERECLGRKRNCSKDVAFVGLDQGMQTVLIVSIPTVVPPSRPW